MTPSGAERVRLLDAHAERLYPRPFPQPALAWANSAARGRSAPPVRLSPVFPCLIGIRGLKQRGLWRKLPLLPIWDALAFCIWPISFGRKSIRWRDQEYFIRDGRLVPATPTAAAGAETGKARAKDRVCSGWVKEVCDVVLKSEQRAASMVVTDAVAASYPAVCTTQTGSTALLL